MTNLKKTRIPNLGLKTRDQPQLENIYAAWKWVCGVATGGVKDLSVRIDEFLYGENGAWRGMTPPKKMSAKKVDEDT